MVLTFTGYFPTKNLVQKKWFFKSIEFNGSIVFKWLGILIILDMVFYYLNFSVTIAMATLKMVTIQNLTAILLS